MQTIEEKVYKLEAVLQEFVRNVGIEFNKVYNLHMLNEIEFKAFKDEMKTFKDEMKVFQNEMKAFKDEAEKDRKKLHEEMQVFKDEMKAFKDEAEKDRKKLHEEMKSLKDEAKEINRDMNRKWGEMANKLGTITEDLVAPSLPRIVREELDLEVTDLMVRRKKKLKDGKVKEYDAIAVAGGYVFVNSTKSSLKKTDVDSLIADMEEFREFFPEFKDYKLIGVLASLYVDEGFIRYAEKKGLMVLSVGDQLMEVKNTKGFKPKEW